MPVPVVEMQYSMSWWGIYWPPSKTVPCKRQQTTAAHESHDRLSNENNVALSIIGMDIVSQQMISQQCSCWCVVNKRGPNSEPWYIFCYNKFTRGLICCNLKVVVHFFKHQILLEVWNLITLKNIINRRSAKFTFEKHFRQVFLKSILNYPNDCLNNFENTFKNTFQRHFKIQNRKGYKSSFKIVLCPSLPIDRSQSTYPVRVSLLVCWRVLTWCLMTL